jgi:hypothetical protein
VKVEEGEGAEGGGGSGWGGVSGWVQEGAGAGEGGRVRVMAMRPRGVCAVSTICLP